MSAMKRLLEEMADMYLQSHPEMEWNEVIDYLMENDNEEITRLRHRAIINIGKKAAR